MVFGTETSLGDDYTVKSENWKEKPKTMIGTHSKDCSDHDSAKFYGNTGSIKFGTLIIYKNQGHNSEVDLLRTIRTSTGLKFEIQFSDGKLLTKTKEILAHNDDSDTVSIPEYDQYYQKEAYRWIKGGGRKVGVPSMFYPTTTTKK